MKSVLKLQNDILRASNDVLRRTDKVNAESLKIMEATSSYYCLDWDE